MSCEGSRCPECGPDVQVTCAACGATSLGAGADAARALNEEIDRLIHAGLESERKKNAEIAVHREALKRVLEHYFREARQGDGVHEDAWDDVAAAMTLAKPDAPRFDEAAIARGLASIHQATGVES